MIKYILHGGAAKHINPDNNSFFAEMTKGTKGKTHILLNYFSRQDEEVEQCATRDKQRFLENSQNKELEFEVAIPEKITEQLQRADIMWMLGGETAKLVEKMKTIPNLEQLFQGKVIGGSSAGVYVLAKHYWENDNNQLGDGLGLFDWKAYCHYKAEDKDKVLELMNYADNLPVLCLPNYKWFVIFK